MRPRMLIVLGVLLIGIAAISLSERVPQQQEHAGETIYEQCIADWESTAAECLAIRKGDPSLCEKLPDADWRAWCEARASGDSSHCDDIQDHERQDNCFLDFAKTESDCDAIAYHNSSDRNECLAYVHKNDSYCQMLPLADRPDCLANVHEDASYCEQDPAFMRRWTCQWRYSDDPDICREYAFAYCNVTFKKDTIAYDIRTEHP